MRALITMLKWLSVLAMGLGMGWLLRTASQHPVQPPQLIFVAGGFEYRERHAARLAQEHNLPVLVSGGLSAAYGRALFFEEGVQGLNSAVTTRPAILWKTSPPCWRS
ncbi:hypothetical protein [Candidatus Synechococcus spongiarum]|uniref:DUF218 domain-containing protein n=1 Tax=Candidatus Synechococcus spongiarum TaxID=431041 RepID=A0A171DI42_9SYNE|nr:hypothetical protein [Candidatus Synechococcus spongiarum]SAY40005.1 hypothetical protein FLM9_36 [Candidatus Synechococcus spongiarum]